MDKSEFIRKLQLGFNNATAAPRMTEEDLKKKERQEMLDELARQKEEDKKKGR